MDRRPLGIVGVIIIAAVLGVAAYTFWPGRTVAPEAPTEAGGNLQTFRGTQKAFFEGWDEIDYTISYPANSFSISSKLDDNPVVIRDMKTSAEAQMKISYEGARGMSLDDYWNTFLASGCPGCAGSARTVASSAAKIFAGAENEWMLMPATGAWLFVAKIPQPARAFESVVGTLTVVATKIQQLSSGFKVYFSNPLLKPLLDPNKKAVFNECRYVVPRDRIVPKTATVATAALEELLKGPTDEEKNQGFTTALPAGSALNSLTIENGVARADFNEATQSGGDSTSLTTDGSCSMAMRVEQIRQTLLQFKSISSVVISVDGKTDGIFQP